MEVYGNYINDKTIGVNINDNPNSYKNIDLILELRMYGAKIIPYINSTKYITEELINYAIGNSRGNKNIDLVVTYNDFNITDEVCNIIHNLNDDLKGKRILVTAGPTPVKIDNVRRITNKFSGKLGIEIAKELYLRGADVLLLQSYSGIRPPVYINHILFDDYDEYKKLCIEKCTDYEYGIFSAAVADYRPSTIVNGKIPSGTSWNKIDLIPTEKVINLVKEHNPNLKMISFKYEEGKTLEQLIEIATKRLNNGHIRVVANDLALNTDKQKCFLCALEDGKVKVKKIAEGKVNIARMIADDIKTM